MSRVVVFGVGTALLLGSGILLRVTNSASKETVFEIKNASPQLAPLCPWRDPQTDLNEFFPGASRWELETRILSGMRAELARQLGRMPTAEENALRVYRIFAGEAEQGEVTTRRVKGNFGAIEMVLAADTNGQIAGLRLQRLREPDPAATALREGNWRQWFAGKRADSSWDSEDALRQLPVEARASGQAIIEGARRAMILLAASEQAQRLSVNNHHQ
jgi:hypothetical protein